MSAPLCEDCARGREEALPPSAGAAKYIVCQLYKMNGYSARVHGFKDAAGHVCGMAGLSFVPKTEFEERKRNEP